MPAAGLSASDDDFYQRLYQRGMTHFAAADYARGLHGAAQCGLRIRGEGRAIRDGAKLRLHRRASPRPRQRCARLADADRERGKSAAALSLDQAARCRARRGRCHRRESADRAGGGAPRRHARSRSRRSIVPTPTKQPNVAVTAPRDGGPDARAGPSRSDPTPAPQPKKRGSATRPLRYRSQNRRCRSRSRPRRSNRSSHRSLRNRPRRQRSPRLATPTPASPMRSARSTAATSTGARSIYNAIVDAPSLSHDAALRAPRGCIACMTSPARPSVRARGRDRPRRRALSLLLRGRAVRDGALRRRQTRAGRGAAVHHVTPDVTRYRAKIEGAIE